MCLMLVAVLFVASCGGRGGSVNLTDSRDSLSYVVGMNIAYNIMQMDSTIYADAVITAIDETLRGRERLLGLCIATYPFQYITFSLRCHLLDVYTISHTPNLR